MSARFTRRQLLHGLACACGAASVVPLLAAEPKLKTYWQMICADCRGEARFGPYRNTYKEALQDLRNHQAKYPKHDADVLRTEK